MSALRFVVPMPPNIANARMHWRVKNRERKAYLAILDQWQAAGLVPAPPKTPLARASIESSMRVGNYMDADNAVARHKWLLDWLQSRGYVVNDRDLTWTRMPSQSICRAEQRITLTLTPLSAPRVNEKGVG